MFQIENLEIKNDREKIKSEFFSKMIVREKKDRKRETRAHWLNKTWNDSLSATYGRITFFLFLDGLIREKMAQQSHWKRNC